MRQFGGVTISYEAILPSGYLNAIAKAYKTLSSSHSTALDINRVPYSLMLIDFYKFKQWADRNTTYENFTIDGIELPARP